MAQQFCECRGHLAKPACAVCQLVVRGNRGFLILGKLRQTGFHLLNHFFRGAVLFGQKGHHSHRLIKCIYSLAFATGHLFILRAEGINNLLNISFVLVLTVHLVGKQKQSLKGLDGAGRKNGLLPGVRVAHFGKRVQNCFRDEFRFLAYSGWVDTPTHSDYFHTWHKAIPGTPGHFEKMRSWIGETESFGRDEGYKALTLAELDALAAAYGNEKWRVPLLENRDFIAAYRSRIAPGADEGAGDPDVRRAALDRLLAFARRLPESQGALKTETLRNILTLERERGNFAERGLFLEFLRDLLHQAGLKKAAYAWRTDDALVSDYLSAYRRVKRDDLADFRDLVPAEQLARICAETDLLSGVPAEKVDASKIPDAEFKKLRERVELRWCASNPKVFRGGGRLRWSWCLSNRAGPRSPDGSSSVRSRGCR